MRRGIVFTSATLLLVLAAAPAWADVAWSGVWVTDEGAMSLEQDGSQVTGTYGRGAEVEAEVSGSKLEGTYREGNVTGRLELVMKESGKHFDGKWIHPSGREGTWRGWKQDEDAESKPAADFGGHWLTSIGTLALEQKGNGVEGPWRHQGWSRVEGKVKGRRMTGTLTTPNWRGQVWLELTPDGKRIYGLTDENPPAAVRGVLVEGFGKEPKLEAGKIAQGIAENGMLYFARPPTGWRKGKAVDAIVLMHGSNWTTKGMVWVTAKNWPKLAKNYMIVGIQGDLWSPMSSGEDPRFNYHYVNWMGKSTYKGYPYTNRDSPQLVSDVVKELAEENKWKRVFIGGHSQGGFMAYLMYMHFPEQFAGVFPIAGGMVIQAEPNVFEDEELLAAQRATPLAIVHGANDNVVPYSTALYIRDRYEGSDFPLLKFVNPGLGHPYDFLPIGEAIDWLDVMSTTKSKDLIAFATDAAKDKRWSDVGCALARAKDLECAKKLKSAATQYDAAAGKDAKRFRELLEKGEAGDWVDEFLEWKRAFGAAPAAAETLAVYRTLKEEHDPKTAELIQEARTAFRERNRSLGKAKYEEILEKYYAAGKYPIVKRWVAGMD